MRARKIFIYGSGGHGRVVLDAAERADIPVEGWIDDTKPRGDLVYGYYILGGSDDFQELVERGVTHGIVAIGNNADRAQLVRELEEFNFRFVAIAHPDASIARSAIIGEGVVVLARAVVNPGALIGRHAIINTGAIVEHDCRIGEYVHIASGVSMGGRVTVGNMSLVGTGAVIRLDITIGSSCVIGAGAVVASNIPNGAVVAGNPARPLNYSR